MGRDILSFRRMQILDVTVKYSPDVGINEIRSTSRCGGQAGTGLGIHARGINKEGFQLF